MTHQEGTKKKISKKEILLYVVFGLFMFIIFLYFTFPIEKLRGTISSEFSKSTGYNLSIEEIDTHFITGIDIENAQISHPDNLSGTIVLDRLKIWLNPFALIIGNTSVSLYSKLYNGTVDGSFSQGGSQIDLDVEIENITLEKIKYFKEVYDMDVSGTLSGEADINTDLSNLALTNGYTNISLPKLSLSEFQIPTPLGPFNMPPISFTKVNGRLDAENGKVKLSGFKLEGNDLNATIAGDINLAKSFRQSTLNLDFEFNIAGELETKFGLIFQNFFKKEPSGMYSCKLIGTIGSPSLIQ